MTADALFPAAELAERRAVVDRECPLRHERPLIEGLHALDRRDAVKVIPLLYLGEPVLS